MQIAVPATIVCQVMPVHIPRPYQPPYCALHPVDAGRYTFREDGKLWLSVAQYCLAQAVAEPAHAERIRLDLLDLPAALERALELPRAPELQPRMFEILCHAYQRMIEQNTELRALLLRTNEEEIALAEPFDLALLGFVDDRHGPNPVGRALMHVRALVAARVQDSQQIQCHHLDAVDARLVCVHRIDAWPAKPKIRRRFTGHGRDYQILCDDCCRALPVEPPLRRVCVECFPKYLSQNLPDVGMPAFLEREASLAFQHEVRPCPEQQLDWIATVPVPDAPYTWLALTRDGALRQLDARTGAVRKLANIDASQLDLSKRVVLAVAARAALVAVAEAEGCRAAVIDPENGRITMRLERESYHEEHCVFPIGFFQLDGRLLLVHATQWNRLDVSDPRSGKLLTVREHEQRGPDEEPPSHYLEYFHASLTISPDGARAAESGWIWTPWALPRAFNLACWIRDNAWESEDGPSVRELPGTGWIWDVPVAWLDATTLAVWGDGDDFETLTPAASIYDVETGVLRRRFDGPAMGFSVIPPYLLASEPERGCAVWDPATGERLHQDASFVPIAAHPNSHELVSCPVAGEVLVSQLVEL